MKPLADLHARWPELNKLLDQALDLSVAEREVWLASLDTGDAELVATLRAVFAANALVETDFMGTLPRLGRPQAGEEPAAGATVSAYRLLQPLGQGGMGAVWLAERTDGDLKRKVALKLPRLAWGDSLVQRMARERDILAALTHPNIARLYDAGVDALGRPWLALEYVPGKPIDVAAREQQLDVTARLRLLMQVCDAVAYAHSLLVIHRDLKPSNILVTDDGQVRLLDFGIAKLVQGERTEETALTRHAGLAMTPDYASPEQVRGEPLGTASDVYSLGVVAYELLTGQRPYRLRRGTVAELEEAIAAADAPRASDATTDPGLKKRLRGDLDAILNRALKKIPAQRYPTVVAFADDIARHLRGHAVLARPDSRLYRARKFVSRYRLVVATASTVVAALAIGLGVALWRTEQARENEYRARLALQREDAVKDLYVEAMAQVAAWDSVTFAKPGSVSRLLQTALADFETRYKDSPERRLGLMQAMITQLSFMDDYPAALDVSERYQVLLKETRADPARQLRAADLVALALSKLNRQQEAERVLSQALADFPDHADWRPNRVEVQAELGKVLTLLGRREEAGRVYAEAVRLAERIDDPSPRWNVQSTHARHYLGHDDPKALRLMQEAHANYVREPTAFPVEVGYSHQFLGVALQRVGRSAEAEAAFRESLRIFEPMFGKSDSDTVLALGRLATVLGAQGRCAQARQLLAERWTEVVAPKAVADATPARAELIKRQLINEVACGDVQAAGRVPALSEAEARFLATRPELGLYVRSLARTMLWTGRGDEAAQVGPRWLELLPPRARVSAEAFMIGIAMVEVDLASGKTAAAATRVEALLVQMREGEATRTSLYREAQECAALAMARDGSGSAALARLQAFDRSEPDVPGPQSPPERADSLLRRAELLLAAGRKEDAASAVRSLLIDLGPQHADSPRLVSARRLQSTLGP